MEPVAHGDRQGAPSNRAIVFIGFMGAGKSKAARIAAEHLGCEAIDSDDALEAELGTPIAELFEREGEAEFRRREATLVTGLLERARGAAIALGGGSVLSESVREALRPHLVVWLDAPVEEAWQRVDGQRRPLARDRGGFERLHAERRPLYESLADAIVPGHRDAVEAALPSLEALRPLAGGGARMLWAESDSGSYPVFIGDGLLSAGLLPAEGRRFCVTDSEVGRLYSAAVGSSAQLAVEPGEQSKTIATAERVWSAMVDAGITRRDRVLALGGGVVGDLAGFCAATYQRGIPLVQLPTTLVAQIDSAIGGKTGVDLPQAKNYVGAYHMPEAVIVDTATLATLPAAEMSAGFAEVLKTGLLAGPSLWERVRDLDALSSATLAGMIFDCIRFKLAIVAEDDRDRGRRMVLNLGHTIGHAIEAAGGYGRYRHGEAVGLGLLAELRLSGAEALRTELRSALERHGLPLRLDAEISTQDVMGALALDKKRTERGVGFVLLERPGEPLVDQLIDSASVEAAVEELR